MVHRDKNRPYIYFILGVTTCVLYRRESGGGCHGLFYGVIFYHSLKLRVCDGIKQYL